MELLFFKAKMAGNNLVSCRRKSFPVTNEKIRYAKAFIR